MSDNIIHLLPDAVANQIAAGEVIQRPASIVKELVENSIDAGARQVKVVIKDAGRTLVQVIDDGCGMTETDARMAFERHATSKIREATDLYTLCTMGFRGEALPSIAAVAQVELLTKREGEELGVKLCISASNVTNQEPVATPVGTQICVRNLFYNLPARRRFLKSDTAEMRHVTNEFLRVALAHPDVALTMSSNGLPVFNFLAGNLKQRVAAVAGKALAQDLLPLETDTTLVKIRGFIGSPHTAKKTCGDQYFFANNRFMKHPYLHKAVMEAYRNIIAPELTPAYFIYIDVDPATLDVNIHPQKTEIKFENDAAIWQLLMSTVRDCLGKYNIMPSIDFDTAGAIDIPVYTQDAGSTWSPEQISQSASMYNPFEHEDDAEGVKQSYSSGRTYQSKAQVTGWEDLCSAGFESALGSQMNQPLDSTIGSSIGSALDSFMGSQIDSQLDGSEPIQSQIFTSQLDTVSIVSSEHFIQLRGKYVVTQVQSGLMVIDQHRAHERVQYDLIERQISQGECPAQQLLFDETMRLGAEDACVVEEMSAELQRAGLSTRYDAEAGILHISSVPGILSASDAQPLIETLLFDYREGEIDAAGSIIEHVARTLASRAAMSYGKQLSTDEMQSLYNQLFDSPSPSLTPGGKKVFTILRLDDIDTYFK